MNTTFESLLQTSQPQRRSTSNRSSHDLTNIFNKQFTKSNLSTAHRQYDQELIKQINAIHNSAHNQGKLRTTKAVDKQARLMNKLIPKSIDPNKYISATKRLPIDYYLKKPIIAYPTILTSQPRTNVVREKLEIYSINSEKLFKKPHDTASNHLMYTKDKISGRQMLIDCGSQVSVVPYEAETDTIFRHKPKLFGAGDSPITTYGKRTQMITIGDVKFEWTFITADVQNVIIGIDLLRAFGIIIDPKNDRLVFEQEIIQCHQLDKNSYSLHVISGDLDNQNPAVRLLKEYPDLMDTVAKGPPKHNVKHRINTGPTRPIQAPMYRYNVNIENQIKQQIQSLVEQGILQPSSSPWASPMAIVIKKDGTVRVCGDFRFINAVTQGDSYSLPNQMMFTTNMRDGKYFSVIDLDKAFWQIPMAEEDKAKTAIQTPFGLYEHNFMAMGLKCSAQTWQRYIDSILLPFRDICFAYVDDIIIYSKTKAEHLRHLRTVFGILNQNGLKINAAKSQLMMEEVNYLGYKVSKDGIAPTGEKTEAINRIPEPKTFRQLKSFIAMITFYAKFIPNFQKIACELTRIKQPPKTPKNHPVELSYEQRNAFNKLKAMLVKHVTLSYPKQNAPLIIETDASGKGIGAVLHQMVDGDLEPLCFYSKAFTPAQQHFDTYRKELEALYQTVVKLNKYLIGAQVVVYTDNKILLANVRNCREIVNQVELRKLITISQLVSEIHYIETARNKIADYLSRAEFKCETIRILNLHLNQFNNNQINYVLIIRRASHR